MKLRDHPKLRGKWPPRWREVHHVSPRSKLPVGEEGILMAVKGPYIHGPKGHLSLIIGFDGEEYCGQIGFDAGPLSQALLAVFRSASDDNMPVRDIGGVDLQL
jgi:hypothetical protein